MAEDDKVTAELELPKDQASIHPADEPENSENSDPTEKLQKQKKLKEEARQELAEAKEELKKVKKERNKLLETKEEEKPEKSEPMSVREALAKELDPTEEGPLKDITGYELGEIVTAPLHPPESQVKDKPVRGQIHNLFVGFALMPIALIALLIFGWSVAIAVALVGAAFIAMGVLVRV